MNRVFRCFAIVLILLFLMGVSVGAQDTDTLYRQQLQASGAEDLITRLPSDVQELLAEYNLDTLNPTDFTNLQLEQVISALLTSLSRHASGPLNVVGTLLGVVLLSALFTGLEGDGHALGLRRTYHSVAVLGTAGAVLVPLFHLLETVSRSVEQVTVFLGAYVPVYGAILLSGGRGVSALSYQTTLLGASQLLMWLLYAGVFPAVTVSLALGCTGSLAEGFCLESISSTIHKTILWTLGLFSTLFSGLLSIQQMVAAAGDSLSGRVLRFSLSSFVPVVGGLLSEAYSTVVGCAGLLRSTVGCFGLVAVCLLVLPPLLSCVCWNLGLHLAAGAAGLFQLSPVEKLCRTAAGAVRVLIAVLAALALLMVVSTTVIVFSAGR